VRFLHQDSTFSEHDRCGPSPVPALRSFSDQCSQKGLSSRTSAMASCATTKETSTSLTALNQSSCSVSAASLQNCSTNTSVVREHSLPPCTTRSECVQRTSKIPLRYVVIRHKRCSRKSSCQEWWTTWPPLFAGIGCCCRFLLLSKQPFLQWARSLSAANSSSLISAHSCIKEYVINV